jgi:hypothetical protein
MAGPEINWGTNECIDWLNGNSDDESVYQKTRNMTAEELKDFVVKQHAAPAGFYKSMNQPPKSSFKDIDWNAVAYYLSDEDD